MNPTFSRRVMPGIPMKYIMLPAALCVLLPTHSAWAEETASPTPPAIVEPTAAPSPTATPVVLIPTDNHDPSGRPSVKADFKGRSDKLDVVLDYRRIDGPPLEFGITVDDEPLTLEETGIVPGERVSFTVPVPYESCAMLTLQAEGQAPEDEPLGCNDRRPPGQDDQSDRPDSSDVATESEVSSPAPTAEPTQPQEEPTRSAPTEEPAVQPEEAETPTSTRTQAEVQPEPRSAPTTLRSDPREPRAAEPTLIAAPTESPTLGDLTTVPAPEEVGDESGFDQTEKNVLVVGVVLVVGLLARAVYAFQKRREYLASLPTYDDGAGS